MSENKSSELVSGAVFLLAGLVFGRILELAAQVFIIRSLSPRVFGKIAFVYTAVITLTTIVLLGIPQGVTRQTAASGSGQSSRVLLAGQVIVFPVAISSCLILYLFPEPISNWLNYPSATKFLPLFSIFIILQSASLVNIGYMRGLKKVRVRILSKDVLPRLIAIPSLLLLVYFNNPIAGAITYWLLVPAISLISSSIFIYNGDVRVRGKIWGIFRQGSKLLKFSIPLAVSSSLLILMTNIDVLFVGFFLESTQVGLYRGIQPLQNAVLVFLTAFVYLYLPIATEHYSSQNFDQLESLYNSVTKWVISLSIPVLILMLFFTEDLLRVVFSTQYVRAGSALAILSIGVLFRIGVGPNGATVQASNLSSIEMYASILGLITNIILNYLLIPRFGIAGAAMATAFGFIIYNFTEVYVIYVKTGIRPFSLSVVASTIITLILLFIVSMVISPLRLTLIPLALISIFSFGVQIFNLAIFGGLDSDDLIIVESIENKTGKNLNVLKQFLRQ
jgi:O-antigen/teichoic acid export membrane protein